ncbi:hypothetical protein DM860_007675 [Cuscuta australis]|uniref:Bet v I/Major latex protein domain-containing protein n=1 Tax=Cuscuta australis TaxID=267555 RepID=A0A328E4M4_9ASTE|nr:hypothetical protein DM860_007675 [Cuscuta australis]
MRSSSPMAAGQEEELEWIGKATAKLQGPKPPQVWSVLVEDFCNIHRWLPAVDDCWQVAGVKGEVGAVRCVATGGGKKLCNETLISVDHGARCLSYRALENNVGIHRYVSTMKVLPAAEGGGDGEAGCRIEWSYEADPLDGMTRERFDSLIKNHLEGMVENLEKTFPLNS